MTVRIGKSIVNSSCAESAEAYGEQCQWYYLMDLSCHIAVVNGATTAVND
ncbi:hypothetical protein [Shewanella algidipiscicola]|nr:hypothetical protein [Shewanella algidipiscicola]